METVHEIELSGLRKCTDKVSKRLDTKPEGVKERQESFSEFSSRELINEGLGGAHEFWVKTRSSPSVVKLGLENGQRVPAQAL
jgi:hypothetical protein